MGKTTRLLSLMKKYLAFIFLTLTTLPLQAAELAGRVSTVISGKQIELLTEQKARFPIELQGIELLSDKPNLMRAAQRRLNGLIGGRFVRVSTDGKRHYGRLLGFVNWGGQEINLTLVQDGLARVVPEQLDAKRRQLYEQREKIARQNQRGHWYHHREPARSLLPH